MLTVLCRHAHFDWQSTVAFVMLLESLMLCKHGYILLYLTLKENTISNLFIIYLL